LTNFKNNTPISQLSSVIELIPPKKEKRAIIGLLSYRFIKFIVIW